MSLPLVQLPTYTIELPVSKKKAKFRPFIVKEEKILLLANEEEKVDPIVDAIIQVMDLATFGAMDVATLPVADLEYLFVKVRERSIGERIQGEITCNACGNSQHYGIDLGKVEVINGVQSNSLKLDDSTIITMKYPTITALRGLDKVTSADMPLSVTATLVQSITIKDRVYDSTDFTKDEMVNWLEHCTESQINIIGTFLDNLPKVVYKDEVQCKNCTEKINVYTEGIDSFFA